MDPTILVYGEPWTGGSTPIQKTEKGSQQGAGFSVFNDHLRDAIKGGNDSGARGFVQTGRGEFAGKIKNGIEGAVNTQAGGFAAAPGESINYVACHDNKTLRDKLAEDKSLSPAQRSRAQRLANAAVILSQGVPFLHSGQELERSKRGEHNSYNLPDSINRIDWRWKARHARTFAFTRGLISLRKAHPVLRLGSKEEILGNRLRFLKLGEGLIGYSLHGTGVTGETWGELVILLNANRRPTKVQLPPGQWSVVVDEDEAGVGAPKSGPKRLSGGFEMPPISVLVAHR